MPSILSALYRGEYTAVNRAYDPGSDYMKLSARIDKLEEEIERALSDELKEKFRRYVRMNGDLVFINGEEDFIEGFRLGVQLMVIALGGEQMTAGT